MERVTVTIEAELLAALDQFAEGRGYANRSEALRDLLREGLARSTQDEAGAGQCLATLTYVYDHAVRSLSRRLLDAQHDRHDLAVATMHVHLDHDACLEVAILRGSAADVRGFAQGLIAERGVQYGALHVVPSHTEIARHHHGPGDATPHVHTSPRPR